MLITIKKPLGMLLEEDEDRNVFVAEIAAGSNAADTDIQENDRIVMVSSTFGDEMWPAAGEGLGKIMFLIKSRAGDEVTLCV